MLLFRQCIDSGLIPCIITEDIAKNYKKALQSISLGTGTHEELGKVLENSAIKYAGFARPFVEQFQRMKPAP